MFSVCALVVGITIGLETSSSRFVRNSEMVFLVLSVLVWGAGCFIREVEAYRHKSIQHLDRLTPAGFEAHVGRTWRRLGWKTKIIGKRGDGGADIIATRGRTKTAIQCKKHTGNVSYSAVQEVFAGMSVHGCKKGIVVATAPFTRDARAHAKTLGIELIDRGSYLKLLEQVYWPDRISLIPSRTVFLPLVTCIGLDIFCFVQDYFKGVH